MKILSELQTSNLSIQFQEFSNLINPQTWQKVANQTKLDMRAAPHLREYLRERHQLALTLSELSQFWSKYKALPEKVSSIPHYQAYTFMSQVVSLNSQLTEKSKKSFIGRVKGAFRNPEDLKAVLQELEIATHLSRHHYHLDLPREIGVGDFDWLATKDELAIEIECKFITREKGRKIKPRQAVETHHLIRTELSQLIKRLVGGLLIRVNLNETEKLKNHVGRQALAKAVKESLLTNNRVQKDWGFVEIKPFELNDSPFTKDEISPIEIQEFLSTSFNITNREIMVQFSPNSRAAIFTLEASKDDSLLESTFDTLEDAARRQLSRTRPGVLCAKFEDLSATQLNDIAKEDGQPSPLRKFASRFLNNPKHNHITCLAFFADGDLVNTDTNIVTREGAVYFFQNDSTQWGKDSRLKVFSKNYPLRDSYENQKRDNSEEC